MEIVEDPKGSAGKALTDNFKNIADDFERQQDEITSIEEDYDIKNSDIQNEESKIESIEKFVISSPLQLYIATNGDDNIGDGSSENPWATLDRAYEFLSTRRFTSEVEIVVKSGHYSFNSNLGYHPDGDNITIIGEDSELSSITNVSYEGLVGTDKEYIITVEDTHGAVAGDYVGIFYIVGDDHSEWIVGYHEITNVDGNNLTILIDSYGDTVASGTITGWLVIYRSIIDGILEINGTNLSINLLGIKDINISNSKCILSRTGFDSFITKNSIINLSQCCGYDTRFEEMSSVVVRDSGFSSSEDFTTRMISSKVTLINSILVGDIAILCQRSPRIYVQSCRISARRGAYVRHNTAIIVRNTEIDTVEDNHGMVLDYNSRIHMRDCVIDNANRGLYFLIGAKGNIFSSTIKNCTTGVFCWGLAETNIRTITFENVTTHTIPSVNNRDNANAFISQV